MSDLIEPMGGRKVFELRGRLAAAVVACLAMVLVALGVVSTAEARQLSKADREFVDSTIETALAEEGQPGISISISGPKGDYSRAYGVRNLENGRPLRLADHFRVGSITKTFTATAVLRQIEQGHLKFSDTLDKFVKRIPNGDQITIRQLLAMRSGLFEYQADPELGREFGEDPLTPFGPRKFLEIIRRNEPTFAPGGRTEYNNSNYFMLGIVLERVTGKSADRILTREVIKPLGLRQTSFPDSARLPNPFARGYCYEEAGLADCTAFNPDLFYTDGAIVSTVGDMAKYAAELGTGALLSPQMQAERLKFAYLPYGFEGPSVFGYGLGIISFGNWLGHNGSVPGYGSEAFYEPRSGAVIAGFENAQTPTLAVFSRVFQRIAAHLYPESFEAEQPYPEYTPESGGPGYRPGKG